MRRRAGWLLALVPLILGLGLALLLQSGRVTDPLLAWTVDLGSILIAAGFLASIAATGFVAAEVTALRREQVAIDAERGAAAEAHRRFVQRLDHELKNPLTAIRIGLADLRTSSLAPGQQEMLVGIAAEADRVGRLAGDLRKLAELETRPLERSMVEIGPLLEEIVEFVQAQPAGAERQILLSVPRAPWPLPPVPGDRDLLFLAIYNLVDNALKFTRCGDTVEVRARPSDDGVGVLIEVADTGIGVPSEEQSQIFEELYRGKEARGISGSGLGLPLVKAIVERHGGRVTVASRPAEGSIFTLRLPLTDG